MASPIVFRGDGFTISSIVAGPLENNVYLVRDLATDASIVVDAAAEPDAIATMCAGTEVRVVVATHGHWDHHGAVPELTERLDVPFLLSDLDGEIAGKEADGFLTPGTLQVGGTAIEVLHTPGHTPGSMCLSLAGVVLTGDTLFPGGPGATRFPYSSFPQIIESIETMLFAMPDDTLVLPGHGASTTMGAERPQLNEWITRAW